MVHLFTSLSDKQSKTGHLAVFFPNLVKLVSYNLSKFYWIVLGVVNKWRHCIREEGISMILWQQQWSLFTIKHDDGVGDVKSIENCVTSFMDDPLPVLERWPDACVVLRWSCSSSCSGTRSTPTCPRSPSSPTSSPLRYLKIDMFIV